MLGSRGGNNSCMYQLVRLELLISRGVSQMIVSPIAQRVLTTADDPKRAIVVSIGHPELDSDPTGDWLCRFYIEGIADAGPHVVHGADSLQALLLAMEDVRRKLDDSGLILVWQNNEPSNFCIPRMVPYLFGGNFARDIERYIDERIQTFGEALAQG